MKQRVKRIWDSIKGYRCKKCGRRTFMFNGNIRCSVCDAKLLDEEVAKYL